MALIDYLIDNYLISCIVVATQKKFHAPTALQQTGCCEELLEETVVQKCALGTYVQPGVDDYSHRAQAAGRF